MISASDHKTGRSGFRIVSVAATIACLAATSPAFAQAYIGGSNQASVQVDLGALDGLPSSSGSSTYSTPQPRSTGSPHYRSNRVSGYDNDLATTIVGGGDQVAEISPIDRTVSYEGSTSPRHAKAHKARHHATPETIAPVTAPAGPTTEDLNQQQLRVSLQAKPAPTPQLPAMQPARDIQPVPQATASISMPAPTAPTAPMRLDASPALAVSMNSMGSATRAASTETVAAAPPMPAPSQPLPPAMPSPQLMPITRADDDDLIEPKPQQAPTPAPRPLPVMTPPPMLDDLIEPKPQAPVPARRPVPVMTPPPPVMKQDELVETAPPLLRATPVAYQPDSSRVGYYDIPAKIPLGPAQEAAPPAQQPLAPIIQELPQAPALPPAPPPQPLAPIVQETPSPPVQPAPQPKPRKPAPPAPAPEILRVAPPAQSPAASGMILDGTPSATDIGGQTAPAPQTAPPQPPAPKPKPVAPPPAVVVPPKAEPSAPPPPPATLPAPPPVVVPPPKAALPPPPVTVAPAPKAGIEQTPILDQAVPVSPPPKTAPLPPPPAIVPPPKAGIEETPILDQAAPSQTPVTIAPALKPQAAVKVLPAPAPAKPAASPSDGLGVGFTAGSPALSPEIANGIDELAARLSQNGDLRVELRSIASGSGSTARRISLARAMAVKSALTGHGIAEDRIDVRALGAPPSLPATDRVDFFITR